MKRTNLVLDEKLLEDATRILGEKTWSATVNKALAEVVSRDKRMKIFKYVGSGIWEGDLAEMRGDNPRRKKRRA
jgi:Arc/MetJ family transcription regulator